MILGISKVPSYGVRVRVRVRVTVRGRVRIGLTFSTGACINWRMAALGAGWVRIRVGVRSGLGVGVMVRV